MVRATNDKALLNYKGGLLRIEREMFIQGCITYMMVNKLCTYFFGSLLKKYIEKMASYFGIKMKIHLATSYLNSSLPTIARRYLVDSPHHSADVFQYMYSHVGSFSALDTFLLARWQYVLKVAVQSLTGFKLFDRDLGVAHADDLFTLFQPHAMGGLNSLLTPEDALVSRRITGFVTNFAK